MKIKAISLILSWAMVCWGSVHASVININMVNHPLGPTTLVGPLGLTHHHQRYINFQEWTPAIAHYSYEGDSWNNPLNGSLNRPPGSLIDSEGGITSIGIGMSELPEGSFTFSYGGSGTNTTEIRDNYFAAQDSWVHPVIVTLEGLEQERIYDFAIYSQSGEGTAEGGRFVFFGGSGQVQESISSGTGRYIPENIVGVNLAVAEGVIPDEDGKILIHMYSLAEGRSVIFNGMQIRSIPEPSAIFLLMTSLGWLLRRRRS